MKKSILNFLNNGIVRAACGSHIGNVRKNNEDNFCLDGIYLDRDHNETAEIHLWKKSFLRRTGSFFAVFDGMGGGDYGEVASYAAAEAASAFLSEGEMDAADISASLIKFCEQTNRKVYRAGCNLGAWQMGCTLVSVYNLYDRIWVCNLGDSRCCLLRDGELMQISVDHVEHRNPQDGDAAGRKPYITQYLGVDPEEMQIEPCIKSLTLQDGDRLLLCSDGLTDMVPEQKIRETLLAVTDPETAVQTLIDMALQAGGRDNVTVMLLCAG